MAIIYLTVAPLLFGQSAATQGAVTGQISDPSGAAVPGAKVTATNLATAVSTTTTSRRDGFYDFPLLGVGQYSLTVTHAGFRTATVKSVDVLVGQTITQNVRLEVGAVTQSVTVSGSAPLLRPSQSTSSTVVSSSMITNLPLSGRRYTDFVLLTPNANADGEFGLVSFGGQQGGGDSGYANGNGASSFTVDGANATSNYFGDARGRTRVPYIFGENSVQEFQVSTSPYSAAYGGAGAGFINTVTKSGTDQVHGNAFYYNRNNSFVGANDAIDKASGRPRPLDILQQFGASIGGPIRRQKAWYFFDYEQQRELDPISVINPGMASVDESSFGVPAGTALPPPSAPFPTPSSVSAPDPTSPVYLQQVSNALNAIHSNLGSRARRRDDISFFPKIDWQPDDADHLTFDYNYNRFSSPGGEITFNPVSGDGIEALPNNYVHDHHATIEWTRSLRPDVLSDFHVSFERDDQIATPSGLVDPKAPSIYIFTPEFLALGNFGFSLADNHEFQWQLDEEVSWVHGRHSIKFGVDYDRTHIADFSYGNFRGNYAFTSPENFALGHYAYFSQSTGNPYFPFSFPYYGFYAQDHIQARKNLTLDLGLREDFQVYPQPKENPAFPLTGQFPNHYNRWAPRFGFAYNPLPHTVVRGGIGMFYEILDGINYEDSVVSNGLPSQQSSTFTIFNSSAAPNAQTPTVISSGFGYGPTFPNTITSPSFFAASSNISLVDPGFRTPTIIESNLEIEQQLTPSMTFTIGTMWSHAYHLIASSAYDMNLIPPAGTTQYCLSSDGATCSGPIVTGPNLDSGLLSEGLINPNLGQINALISPGVDNYNSLYVELERRLAAGLEGLVSYTYSKDMCLHGVDFYNQFNLSNTSSPCLLDQRQRLSIAGVYLPHFNFSGDAARALLSNWMISTNMAFNSGRPYAALLNSAPSGNELNDSAFNETTGNTAVGINGAGPSPLIGLNAFTGPGIAEVDLALARTFHLPERRSLRVEAEMFNVPNTANFYVQNGTGNNPYQYNPQGPTCGDGASANQQCFLVPNKGPGGFGTLNSIDQLNGPRVMQFSVTYAF